MPPVRVMKCVRGRCYIQTGPGSLEVHRPLLPSPPPPFASFRGASTHGGRIGGALSARRGACLSVARSPVQQITQADEDAVDTAFAEATAAEFTELLANDASLFEERLQELV